MQNRCKKHRFRIQCRKSRSHSSSLLRNFTDSLNRKQLAAPEIAPIPPMQHRGGAYPYNRPIHLPSESHSEEDSQDNLEE